mmetsp:Transcript_23782/g.38313  ORF Transcript_23782/g.38313 Transcript_23782/m.38313 type:complete len:230 (+) Transcript_23782:216-905(+)
MLYITCLQHESLLGERKSCGINISYRKPSHTNLRGREPRCMEIPSCVSPQLASLPRRWSSAALTCSIRPSTKADALTMARPTRSILDSASITCGRRTESFVSPWQISWSTHRRSFPMAWMQGARAASILSAAGSAAACTLSPPLTALSHSLRRSDTSTDVISAAATASLAATPARSVCANASLLASAMIGWAVWDAAATDAASSCARSPASLHASQARTAKGTCPVSCA